ncbi:MAG: HEAT repeat domain-containing protein [Actinomycetia bacterium]|nr:HEAT repeat domain-containing protein [Actinomycetes bacterium]
MQPADDVLEIFVRATTPREMTEALALVESSLGYWFAFGPQVRASEFWDDSANATRYLEKYSSMRSRELDAMKRRRDSDLMDMESPLFDYLLVMLAIVENIGGDLENQMDLIFRLAESDDPSTAIPANKLLARLGDSLSGHEHRILAIMEMKGLTEMPLILGQLLIRRMEANPGLIDSVTAVLATGNRNLKAALLSTIGAWQRPPAGLYSSVLPEVRTTDQQLRKLAVIALGRLPDVDSAVDQVLLDCLQDARWYIRAVAARSSGYQRRHPQVFVPLIAKLVDDFEGTDLTVAEEAIEALARYGTDARSALPRLKPLLGSRESQQHDLDDALQKSIDQIEGES